MEEIESTRLWRKAIFKQYLKEKLDQLNAKPREFYKTFKPFLDTKAHGTDNSTINISINSTIEKDQRKAAEHFANYFATMALNIGGENLHNKMEKYFEKHTSVQEISQNNNRKIKASHSNSRL